MKMRSLLIIAFLGILLFPTMSLALEAEQPITEIEKSVHFAIIDLEPLYHRACPSPIPPRIPPIISDSKSNILSANSSPSSVDNKAISTSVMTISNGSIPISNATIAQSQTERLTKLLEGVMKKLR